MSRSTQHLNKNRQFMVGIFVMVFAVFCVVGIFLMMCFDKAEELSIERNEYRIELAKGFAGDSIQVMVNDSVLYFDLVPNDSVTITVKPFDEQHLLSVGNVKTGQAKNMNINSKSGRIILRRTYDKNDITKMEMPFEK